MALRNFWLEAKIDGRRSDLSGGPASRTGGLNLTIYQRDTGTKTTALTVHCYETDGQLNTQVYIGGKLAGTFTTER